MLLLIASLSLGLKIQADASESVSENVSTTLEPNPLHTCNLKKLGINPDDDEKTFVEKIKTHISSETTGATCGLITAFIDALVNKFGFSAIKALFS